MVTGYRGTFVISWSQTELDGLTGAPVVALSVGSTWRWQGKPLRVDGPADVLQLSQANGDTDLHHRAARMVQKLVGRALEKEPGNGLAPGTTPRLHAGFDVTDGQNRYRVTLIEPGPHMTPLVMFAGAIPPAATDLWVIETDLQKGHLNRVTDQPTGVICFTPGTLIRTEDGAVPVENLREGDRIQTRDNGAREVLWIGTRHITGARLYAMPELRPVRLHPDALGEDRPDRDLVVSPRHRVLMRGAAAQALFNEDEVLVAAEDLVDGRLVHRDHLLKQVTYHHLLLDRHEIVWANGVETESFHPASASLETIEPGQRSRLFEMFPDLADDPSSYGDFSRRNLSRSEAAILRAQAA